MAYVTNQHNTSYGPNNMAYLSSIPSFDYRELENFIIDPYRQRSLVSILGITGRTEVTQQWWFGHFERTNLWELIDTTGATITNSGTPTVTCVLASSALSGYAQRGVTTRIGGITCVLWSVVRTSGVATLVIKSLNGANVTLTAGTLLPTVGAAFGEGSKPADNIRYSLNFMKNYVGTYREHDEFTDAEGRSRRSIPMPDGSLYYNREQADRKLMSLNGKIDAGLFSSMQTTAGYDSGTPSLVDVDNKTIQTSMGIFQYMATQGNASPLSTPGTYTYADFTAMEDQLTAAFAPMDMTAYCSIKSRRPLAEYVKNLTGSSSLTTGRLHVDGRDFDMMIDSVTTTGGYNIDLMPLDALNNPQGLGGAEFGKYLYLIPKDNIETAKDGAQPRLKLRYIEQYHQKGNGAVLEGTSSYMYKEINTGGLADTPTGGELMSYTDWSAYVAPQMFGAQHTMLVQTVA